MISYPSKNKAESTSSRKKQSMSQHSKQSKIQLAKQKLYHKEKRAEGGKDHA